MSLHDLALKYALVCCYNTKDLFIYNVIPCKDQVFPFHSVFSSLYINVLTTKHWCLFNLTGKCRRLSLVPGSTVSLGSAWGRARQSSVVIWQPLQQTGVQGLKQSFHFLQQQEGMMQAITGRVDLQTWNWKNKSASTTDWTELSCHNSTRVKVMERVGWKGGWVIQTQYSTGDPCLLIKSPNQRWKVIKYLYLVTVLK